VANRYPPDARGWRRERDSNSHVPKDAGLANRWDTITRPLHKKLAERRRFELLCPFGAAVFRTAGLPFAHPLRWWLETELNGLSSFSDSLCHPTRSIQPLSKNLEHRLRLELSKSGFAIRRLDRFGIRCFGTRGGHRTPMHEAPVPKTGVSANSTTRAKLKLCWD